MADEQISVIEQEMLDVYVQNEATHVNVPGEHTEGPIIFELTLAHIPKANKT